MSDRTSPAIFDRYAAYYDWHYADKDYSGEAEFVLRLARRYGVRPRPAILEMGCGTGGHLVPLVEAGAAVTGFDLSPSMVRRAARKVAGLAGAAKVRRGDARSYRDGEKYDLVLSMFAVMGYLSSNEDFFSGLLTARAHLHEGGIFVFDVWYGPAVLSEKPEVRIQRLGGNRRGGRRAIRMVLPTLEEFKQRVRVRYHILRFSGDTIADETEEEHCMRFFFPQELRFFLQQAGFEVLRICPFMDESREPEVGDWNITVAARAVKVPGD